MRKKEKSGFFLTNLLPVCECLPPQSDQYARSLPSPPSTADSRPPGFYPARQHQKASQDVGVNPTNENLKKKAADRRMYDFNKPAARCRHQHQGELEPVWSWRCCGSDWTPCSGRCWQPSFSSDLEKDRRDSTWADTHVYPSAKKQPSWSHYSAQRED